MVALLALTLSSLALAAEKPPVSLRELVRFHDECDIRVYSLSESSITNEQWVWLRTLVEYSLGFKGEGRELFGNGDPPHSEIRDLIQNDAFKKWLGPEVQLLKRMTEITRKAEESEGYTADAVDARSKLQNEWRGLPEKLRSTLRKRFKWVETQVKDPTTDCN